MTMTRQHFELIAKVLSDMKPQRDNYVYSQDWQVTLQHWHETVKQFVSELDQTNDNFNLSKFLDACDFGKNI